MTEDGAPRPKRKARPKEENMKMMAAAAVILCKKEVAPALPKTVWLDPPKAAPISAPLPLWSKTINMRARQTVTWIRIRMSFMDNPSIIEC
jgi:hypothetical protein